MVKRLIPSFAKNRGLHEISQQKYLRSGPKDQYKATSFHSQGLSSSKIYSWTPCICHWNNSYTLECCQKYVFIKINMLKHEHLLNLR